MMPILKSVRGVSLFELLVVLAMISLAASITLFSMSTAFNASKLRFIADQLVTDLKRTRLHAERRQQMVAFHITPHGYSIPELNLHRTFTPKITLSANFDRALWFYHNGRSNGGVVTVQRHNIAVDVHIDQLNGKIIQTL